MDTHTTQTTLNEEKNQSSSRVRTQGDLWDEIAEEGYDSLPLPRLKKTTASTAPIIADGKTLDELVKGDKFMERITRDMREDGATDQEIWQFAKEN